MTFGELLRAEREGRGLTRKALAASSGVPFGTIHGYEIGRRAPSFGNVVKLAAALGLKLDAFAECALPEPEPLPRRPRRGRLATGRAG